MNLSLIVHEETYYANARNGYLFGEVHVYLTYDLIVKLMI